MKFRFLGTAAAEGVPAIFCNCDVCKKAREIGGKEIRTRSQSIINDDFLIDLPADTYMHFLTNGIEGHKIKYLFITHSHQDHFYTEEFNMRKNGFAHNMEATTLNLYCTKGAYEKFCNTDKPLGEYENIKATLIEPYKSVSVGEYEVIPLPANHYKGDDAVFYIIKNKGKTLLYAHDTGILFPEVFDFIAKENFKFDFITFDCTNGELVFDDKCNHMGFNHIERVLNKFKESGAIDSKTQMYVNHFSHNGNPITDNIEKLCEPFGLKVAYDGLTVEI